MSGITDAANDLLDMMAWAGKLVPEGPSGSFHGTGGYTKYEGVSGSGSSGGSGASGAALGKGVENSGPAQAGVIDGVDHSVPILGRGPTGRTEAKSLTETLFMQEVRSNPLENAKVLDNVYMSDERWPAEEGWLKMERRHKVEGTYDTVVHLTTIQRPALLMTSSLLTSIEGLK